MSDTITFTIDGVEVEGRRRARRSSRPPTRPGIYIPRLCALARTCSPFGSCRVCTVHGQRPAPGGLHAAGRRRAWSSRTTPSELQRATARSIIEMLFVEGNHFCMFCEKSGNCELQALAYRFGITAPQFPYLFPEREVDASHPDILIDHNRCILCARCVRASRDLDGKNVFEFVGRGPDKRVAVNAERPAGRHGRRRDRRGGRRLPGRARSCKKRVGYAVPIGQRLYDHEPIGSDIEARGRRTRSEDRRPWPNPESPPRRSAGCFGCHMSLLDIDERILQLVELVDFDSRPIDDIKEFTGRCAVGLIEGGCCNEENVRVLQEFRKHCDVLDLGRRLRDHGRHPGDAQHGARCEECLEEAYLDGPTVHNPGGHDPQRPGDPAAAGQGLPLPRGGQDRLPPARLPAARRTRIWAALAALLDGQAGRAAVRADQVRLTPEDTTVIATATARSASSSSP